jgi:hypothetical protein
VRSSVSWYALPADRLAKRGAEGYARIYQDNPCEGVANEAVLEIVLFALLGAITGRRMRTVRRNAASEQMNPSE